MFALSRKVDGVYDGVDFGDGMTPVTLHLPITGCSAVTRYALTELPEKQRKRLENSWAGTFYNEFFVRIDED